MTWLTDTWCPFDLETTGISPEQDRIVSWCVGRVGGGEGTVTLTGLVNPGIPIPEQASAIHRITDDLVVNEPTSRDAAKQISGLLVDAQRQRIPIVGWNVSYDLTLLTHELLRYGLPTLEEQIGRPLGPVLDGLVLDKHVEPYRRGSRKLTDVATYYDVPLAAEDAHGAEADAVAAARIVYKIGARYDGLRDMDLYELHQAQIHWRQEQMDSLRAYFDRKGIEHDGCDSRWPLCFPPLGGALRRPPTPMPVATAISGDRLEQAKGVLDQHAAGAS